MLNSKIVDKNVFQEVWVRFALEGFHYYPDAPDSVAYLKNEHRHMFHYEVSVQTWDQDREVEFHMMKNWLLFLFKSNTLQSNYKSCEMMAVDLLKELKNKYGTNRVYKITVSEDLECGSTITYTPEA